MFLPGDHHHYGEVSERVMTIFRSFTPLVELKPAEEKQLELNPANSVSARDDFPQLR